MKIDGVWKKFTIPHEKRANVFDYLASVLSIFEGERYTFETFWALKDINVNLDYGESLGIIGSNGSGKSTLLKLIAHIMNPEKGLITLNGSSASILELGLGFHGDLTVKENAVVYGVLMGIPRSEIKKRIPEIVDFGGLTRFQDAKLKTLSTGMSVRLAFSIAIQTKANIFLIDEALAVGDAEFQEKCFRKFTEFKRDKKSIILVSHNMKLINRFCEKTLYLANGEVRTLGNSDEVTSRYLQDVKSSDGTINNTLS